MSLRTVMSLAAAACVAGAYAAPSAHAQALVTPVDQTAQAAPAAPATPPPAPPKHPIFGSPIGDIQISGHTELGLSINPDSPANNANFGQPFTNGANAFRMNQTMFTVEHDTDSAATAMDYGFKFQTFYGTDARLTHFYNEFDRATNGPYQWDINYAELNMHAPPAMFVSSGADFQIGEYATPLGYEVIDATGNPFYSHSYIFTYGLPYKHTGILGTFHVNDTVDIWGGWDTGVNDSFVGAKGNANASLLHGILGFGLNNLMGGNLTLVALAHLGAENPVKSYATNVGGANPYFIHSDQATVQYYDANGTYKINDNLNITTEVNLIKNDAYGSSGGGLAQYVSYTLNDQWTLGARAEGFADQSKGNGFTGFVTDCPGGQDAVDAERNTSYSPGPGPGGGPLSNNNVPNGCYGATGPNNIGNKAFNVLYSELTIGASYTPPLTMPSTLGLVIRPEARLDNVIGGSRGLKPYDVNSKGNGTKTDQITLAVDAILSF
ncbi:MAG: outer membrane beta-barrel protein [Stellaceae bacterium]|jgi:hypothetical protein